MTVNIDKDYSAWLSEQAELLRSHSFEKLDIENLVEELETLVRNEKGAVKSFVFLILMHKLLVDYWTEQSQTIGHWEGEIGTFQYQLSQKMTTNFRNMLEAELNKIYAKARKTAIKKSQLPGERFPVFCPYSLKEILED